MDDDAIGCTLIMIAFVGIIGWIVVVCYLIAALCIFFDYVNIKWMWYICYYIIVSIWNIDNAIMDWKGINILEGIEMRKWRISYRAIHNLYVSEYRDLLFWYEMDIREDVDNYLRDMGIKKTTIS